MKNTKIGNFRKFDVKLNNTIYERFSIFCGISDITLDEGIELACLDFLENYCEVKDNDVFVDLCRINLEKRIKKRRQRDDIRWELLKKKHN